MIGFIGTGNMGMPLISGAIEAFGHDNVIIHGKNERKNDEISCKSHIVCGSSNVEVVKLSDIIVLAIKPQVYDEVFAEIKTAVIGSSTKKTFVSLAPGRTCQSIESYFEDKVNVVRAMPNTPAQIKQGMTAIAFSDNFNGKKDDILKIFSCVGKSVCMPERLIDSAIVASGSSPAFVYMFIEALADASVKYGIPREQAIQMAAQTVLGSAKMVLETNEHPAVLKDKVCSPGGTTICGVAAMEEHGFRNAIIKGCDAIYDKATSLKK